MRPNDRSARALWAAALSLAAPLALISAFLLPAALSARQEPQGAAAGGQPHSHSGRIISLRQPEEGSWEVLADGEPFTSLRIPENSTPCFYPVLAEGRIPVTRGFPLDPQPGEPNDHPHHHSLWLAHGDLNGVDFWTGRGITRLGGVECLLDGPDPVLAVTTLLEKEGDPVCEQVARWSFRAGQGWRSIRCAVRFSAIAGDLVFGDTKEGFFAMRVHPGLQMVPPPGKDQASGSARNSEGGEGPGIWGHRARWVCYSGTVDDRPVSVCLFDHPANLRHPTTWHARDYGLVAANPFGLHDFEQQPKGTGNWTVTASTPLELEYEVLVFSGEPPTPETIESHFDAFAGKTGGKQKAGPEERRQPGHSTADCIRRLQSGICAGDLRRMAERLARAGNGIAVEVRRKKKGFPGRLDLLPLTGRINRRTFCPRSD